MESVCIHCPPYGPHLEHYIGLQEHAVDINLMSNYVTHHINPDDGDGDSLGNILQLITQDNLAANITPLHFHYYSLFVFTFMNILILKT